MFTKWNNGDNSIDSGLTRLEEDDFTDTVTLVFAYIHTHCAHSPETDRAACARVQPWDCARSPAHQAWSWGGGAGETAECRSCPDRTWGGTGKQIWSLSKHTSSLWQLCEESRSLVHIRQPVSFSYYWVKLYLHHLLERTIRQENIEATSSKCDGSQYACFSSFTSSRYSAVQQLIPESSARLTTLLVSCTTENVPIWQSKWIHFKLWSELTVQYIYYIMNMTMVCGGKTQF